MGAFRVGEKAPSFYFIKIQKRRNSHGVRKFVAQSQNCSQNTNHIVLKIVYIPVWLWTEGLTYCR